ncbi:MAG: peptidylprolyl isomerase [bacterium]
MIFRHLFIILLFFTPYLFSQEQSPSNYVRLLTNKGSILIELFPKKAPETVANFLKYVDSGFYTNVIFHRVVPGFVMQGGGFDINMVKKETLPAIKNEADNGLLNKKYTLSMARTPDPHSASSQFFINVSDNPFLDFRSKTSQGWGYAVFARVLPDSYSLIDTLSSVSTKRFSYHTHLPVQQIIIERVERYTP